jgi:hypothetical protein
MAKAALLSGPVEGRRVLGRHGGLLVHDDGRVEVVGAMSLSLRIPAMPARSAPGGQVAA